MNLNCECFITATLCNLNVLLCFFNRRVFLQTFEIEMVLHGWHIPLEMSTNVLQMICGYFVTSI